MTVQLLLDAGLTVAATSRLTGVPARTIREWRLGSTPDRTRRDCRRHDPANLPREQYAYLLGVYLGDGCLSAHPRGVWRLRITCDAKYPAVIDAVADAMASVRGDGSASIYRRPTRCVDVGMYWKHWPCVFPQHGPGVKSARKIRLVSWQQTIVSEEREAFLCGLIDSDGCRIVATYREARCIRRYGRYVFTNTSEDILGLFTDSLDALGVHWTRASPKDIAVARQADVRRLDSFIGPKC